jgi:hypothetical protein
MPLAARAATEPTGEVAGTVVSSEAKGVVGVQVTIARTKSDAPMTTATSSEDGSFLLQHVPPGKDLHLRALKPLKPNPARVGPDLHEISAGKDGISVEPGKKTDVGKLELKIRAKQ